MSIKEYEVLEEQGLNKMLEYLLVNLGPKIVSPLTLERVVDEIKRNMSSLDAETKTKVSQEVFDQCEKDVQDLIRQALALSGRLDKVEPNLENARSRLTNAEISIGTIQGRYESLSPRVTDLQDRMTNTVEPALDLAKAGIKNLNDDLDSTQDSLAELTEEVSKTKTDVTGIHESIDEMKQGLSEVTGSVSDIRGEVSQVSSDVDSLSSRLDSLSDRIDQIGTGGSSGGSDGGGETDIPVGDLDEINRRLNELHDQGETHSQQIEQLTTFSQDHDQKIMELQTGASELSTKVSDLDSKLAELEETGVPGISAETDEAIKKLQSKIKKLRNDLNALGVNIETTYVKKETFDAVIDLLKSLIGSGNVGGGTGGGNIPGYDPDLLEGYVTITTFNQAINGLKDRITTLEDSQIVEPEGGFVGRTEFEKRLNDIIGGGDEETDEGEDPEQPPVVNPDDPSNITSLKDAVSKKVFEQTVAGLNSEISALQNKNSVLEGVQAQQAIEINILKATIVEMKAMIEEILEHGSIPPADERPNIVGIENAIFTIEDGHLTIIHPDDELAVGFYIDSNGHLQMCYNSIAPDLHIDENGHLILVYDEDDPSTTGIGDDESVGTPVEEASFTLSPTGNLAISYEGEEMEVQPFIDKDGHLKFICNNDNAKLVINNDGHLIAIT